MTKHKQPPQKPCPNCGKMYRVTSTCKGCGQDLFDYSNVEGAGSCAILTLKLIAGVIVAALILFTLIL